ncbi:PorP/SprF family type IX secretion system membrane protein [Maribacter polysiphoniae]|uniref:PorP/SprF family type IX secretion system membrane protein n=2 Tax=Maribacter polysiphoniae TaxID=429344 RepID=A0A316ESC5_9FLAO|nr:PorP/SprF family type IX secretion system membrane protein [Maribacter polysiphoniae]MBD1262341.1 PorP/SprF family type IX secretion system membrane protein [Maribacter polysiphoniae]PWK26040.1 type IX secretion system PorP/SprF family membrane protein [Maribacter polysiphoniae]
MDYNITIIYRSRLLIVIYMMLCVFTSFAQETASGLSSRSAYHNQLFFNRFLINPTFSLVRENKSYLNILHRNQYATFEDNSQNYFLGFSNKLNENTAVGIGVYSQWEGVVQEFGFNANYARAVQLGEKSRLTFGTNVSYYNEGLDKNRVITNENDPEVLEASKQSKIAIQPGVTLSVGSFDFGLYAEDLFKFNQTTNEFLTQLDDKSIKASLQYTHSFGANMGMFKNARLMPLLQVGRNDDNTLSYMGSVLLDMPKYGWLQTTLDDTYGLSMGLGFNISNKMSIGYLMEKNIKQEDADLGFNHELSLAYTFKDSQNLKNAFTDNSEDEKIDRIVRNYEEQILALMEEKKNKSKVEPKAEPIEEILTDKNDLAYQNRLILDELILRQDSLERARNNEFEKRFESIVRVLRNDLKKNIKSNLQEFTNGSRTVLVTNDRQPVESKDLNELEHKDYVKLPIKVLGQSDMIGVESGYYVIVNVYKNKRYLNAFVDNLKHQGLNAKHFFNKSNGLYYVYLADYDIKKDAETAIVSNLEGEYRDEKWIMQVQNSSATAANLYND